MCASINDKNCNYRPYKSFITQNHLLIYGKKHREKIRNTGKTQGILSRLECGHPGTSCPDRSGLGRDRYPEQVTHSYPVPPPGEI